ncbi:hypothetical protein C1646_765370 [Rhizophagus diaphanus]|nr:hypothetical protein C1646_765370 [Rhizophagus diaphanus] [Rhizophagus sp. MUCL 43196]
MDSILVSSYSRSDIQSYNRKTHFYNHHQIITFEHYTHITESHLNYANLTLRLGSSFINKCKGCQLSERNIYNQIPTNTCYISTLSNSTFIIQTSKSDLLFPYHTKPIYKCVKQYSSIKKLALIDFNERNNLIVNPFENSDENPLYNLQLNNIINLDLLNSLNKDLIIRLITPNSLHLDLLNISLKLSSFTDLEFYTDGSLSRDNDTLIIGYGWIFSSDLTYNIIHSGSAIEWASSTKAELIAIITALITCPPNSNVTIYTDSNNCIDTYNKMQFAKLTTHRFQKLNNCILWNAMKQIIDTLELKISFIKVKAHSN